MLNFYPISLPDCPRSTCWSTKASHVLGHWATASIQSCKGGTESNHVASPLRSVETLGHSLRCIPVWDWCSLATRSKWQFCLTSSICEPISVAERNYSQLELGNCLGHQKVSLLLVWSLILDQVGPSSTNLMFLFSEKLPGFKLFKGVHWLSLRTPTRFITQCRLIFLFCQMPSAVYHAQGLLPMMAWLVILWFSSTQPLLVRTTSRIGQHKILLYRAYVILLKPDGPRTLKS